MSGLHIRRPRYGRNKETPAPMTLSKNPLRRRPRSTNIIFPLIITEKRRNRKATEISKKPPGRGGGGGNYASNLTFFCFCLVLVWFCVLLLCVFPLSSHLYNVSVINEAISSLSMVVGDIGAFVL